MKAHREKTREKSHRKSLNRQGRIRVLSRCLDRCSAQDGTYVANGALATGARRLAAGFPKKKPLARLRARGFRLGFFRRFRRTDAVRPACASDQASRTLSRKPSTSLPSVWDWPLTSFAALRTILAAWPLASAASMTPEMFFDTSWAPVDAS